MRWQLAVVASLQDRQDPAADSVLLMGTGSPWIPVDLVSESDVALQEPLSQEAVSA